MARHRRQNGRRQKRNGTSFWLSYSDMLAALLMTFVLIFAGTLMQSRKQYEEDKEELMNKQILLNEQESELENQKKQMESQAEELSLQESELEAQKNQVDTLIEQNGIKESELEAQKSQVEALIEQNGIKESELEAQQAIVKSQKLTMAEQQQKLDRLLGIRSDLVAALVKEFGNTDLGVRIDPRTGAIAFDSSIMFDYNDAQIKQSGKDFLTRFLPRYLNVLLNDKFRDYISEIIIEGHTDTTGSYLFNLELSQKRALSVAAFCLGEDKSFANVDSEALRKIITANGRSFSDPILKKDGTIDMDGSRRVEFKFRLKDEDMITEMMNILGDELMTEE